jgi:hypothetical protein
MRDALRLGNQKTLSVVQSHYGVDVTMLATGYIVADDLDDNGAEAKANRLDAPATDIITDDFEEALFPNAPPPPRQASRALKVVGHSGP